MKDWKDTWFWDALIVCGIGALLAGLGMMWFPLMVITAGALLLGFGALGALKVEFDRQERAKKRDNGGD